MADVDRWLLNTFSTLELVVLVAGTCAALALLGHWVIWRRFPGFAKGDNNDVAGFVLALVSVLYGIMLGFVVVALYERFNAAQENVSTEATALSQIYRATLHFPPGIKASVDRQIEQYSLEVRRREWADMKHGKEDERGWQQVLQLERTLENFEPVSASDQIYAGEAADKVNDLVSARRTRLNQAEDSLPSVFQALLLVGAAVTIGLLWFFGMSSRRAQMMLTGSTAALLGFCLVLVLVLDFPFAGQVSVSNAEFHAGALSTLGP